MGKKLKFVFIVMFAAALSWGTLRLFVVARNAAARPLHSKAFATRTGTLAFDFDRIALARTGLTFIADGNMEDIPDGDHATFVVENSSTLQVITRNGVFERFAPGRLTIRGAFLVQRPGLRAVIGNLALVTDVDGTWTIRSLTAGVNDELAVFDLTSAMVDFDAVEQRLSLVAELTITPEWSDALQLPEVAGMTVGTLWTQTIAEPVHDPAETTVVQTNDDPGPSNRDGAALIGPDVVVADLQSVARFFREGDITAYAVGTHACNVGDQRAKWVNNTNQHPVIVQNMYRLKDDRFEQIGLSWVKHGFYAVSMSLCGPCNDLTPGDELGVGCSDPYSASLNGVQNNMSPRSTVNAHTGSFPYPWSGWSFPPESDIERRLQVHDADLDPDLNPGALYFVQGHYITAGDCAAGTSDNNASYREVFVTEPQYQLYAVAVSGTKPTQRSQPAVRAWQDHDPDVIETDIRVPAEGLFILAAKAIDLGGGWRYSYALQNLNSDRSARSFSLPLPSGAVITNIGFHDVDYHSGEPYDGTDWSAVVTSEDITWSTQTAAENPNANALRFGTVYSFYFDANVEPGPSIATIGLFKPPYPEMPPGEVSGSTVGPKVAFIDCNRNGVSDICDISCDAFMEPDAPCADVPGCGLSIDCNNNGVPDECEPDCNENGVADGCDISSGTSTDCNGNRVPDECEPDCNNNGIADDCEVLPDTDGDGVDDCVDLCPETTPPNTCICPDYGVCCFPPELGGQCVGPMTPVQCISYGGTPECMPQPCRQGCLIGDFDLDGTLDLCDAAAYQRCISLDVQAPGYVVPPQECSIPLDYDGDDDVDLKDFQKFGSLMDGPRP